MNLTTLAKVKAHLSIASDDRSKDAKLQEIIEGVSDFIEGETSRKFGAQIHTLKFSGDNTKEIFLPQYPIITEDDAVAITTLEVDGVSVLDEILSGDIDADAEVGSLYRKKGWPNGRRNIKIVYAAGYLLPDESGLDSGLDSASNLPSALVLAATRLVGRIYERSTAEGVASASPSSFSVTYKSEIDDDIKATIGRFARARVG